MKVMRSKRRSGIATSDEALRWRSVSPRVAWSPGVSVASPSTWTSIGGESWAFILALPLILLFRFGNLLLALCGLLMGLAVHGIILAFVVVGHRLGMANELKKSVQLRPEYPMAARVTLFRLRRRFGVPRRVSRVVACRRLVRAARRWGVDVVVAGLPAVSLAGVERHEEIDLVSGSRRFAGRRRVRLSDFAILPVGVYLLLPAPKWLGLSPDLVWMVGGVALLAVTAAIIYYRLRGFSSPGSISPVQTATFVVMPGRVETTGHGNAAAYEVGTSVLLVEPYLKVPWRNHPSSDARQWAATLVRKDGAEAVRVFRGDDNPGLADLIGRWVRA